MTIQGWAPVVGGAQRQLAQLAPLLAARGVRPTVVTRWSAGLPRRESADGHAVRRVGNGWSSPLASARFVAAGAAAIVAERPALVHAHDLLSATLCAAAGAAPLRVPLVVKIASTGPGGDIDVVRSRPGGRERLRVLLPRIAAFACVATDVVDELTALGVAPERCELLPNGVDLGRGAPAAAADRTAVRRALGLPENGMLVLFTGRLRAVKRLDVLAEACAAAGATLVLVGEGPEAAALSARPGTVVRSAVADVGPYLRAADVYASASLTEGLSNAMLEAMACGLPVVSVPASGVGALLASGGGVMADGEDVRDLAAALATLHDAARRDLHGRAARDHVVRHHDLAATADALVALYRRLAPPPGRVRPTKTAGACTCARSRGPSAAADSLRTS